MNKKKVFGVCIPKTGTNTLVECLRLMGYRVCDLGTLVEYKVCMLYETDRFLDLVELRDGFANWPWFCPSVYRMVAQVFPESRFVVTTRDPDLWYTSLMRWIIQHGPIYNEHVVTALGLNPIVSTEGDMKRAYMKQIAEAKSFLTVRAPDRLLTVDWAAGDGWDKLCDFLEEPAPDAPFPHLLRYDSETNRYTDFPPIRSADVR